MTARRRPPRLDDLDIERTLQRAVKAAPELELGWSLLKAELRDAGWPARTPEDDRKPSRPGNETSTLDYADPTGEGAGTLEHHHGDLLALQDHWHIITVSLRAITTITAKYLPVAATASVPVCDIASCGNDVESYTLTGGRVGYRGMVQIAGIWVARAGEKPTCARHRKRRNAA